MSNSFATLWTITHQVPLSMGFSRQEYWNRLPFSSLGDLPYPGIESMSPASAGRFFNSELHIYLQLLYLLLMFPCSLYSVNPLVTVFILKFLLSDISNVAPAFFFLIFNFMEYLYLSPHFRSVCVPKTEVCLF